MKNILFYDRPAAAWEHGLPVGNGRIGAMLQGQISEECISLNEDTLWSGYPLDYTDEEVRRWLPRVREAIFEKRYREAEDILNKHMTGVWTESYLPMADLTVSAKGLNRSVISDYERTLDLSRALCTTSFRADGKAQVRSTFCSCPDQVLVFRFRSEEPQQLKIGLTSKLRGWNETEGDMLFFHGWCPEVVEPSYYECEDPVRYASFEETRSIRFEVGVKVLSTDGKIGSTEGRLVLSDCRDCVLLVSSANSFVRYDQKPEGEYRSKLRNYLDAAAKKSFEELLERHLEDYRELFGRVELEFGHTEQERLPMGTRLKKLKTAADDPELIATAFQFGRYLTIASSREGSQPANLQGIWNQELRAPWSSNYTVNINLEMNYWPTEISNLSECTEPLMRFIGECAQSGAKTAAVNYGCRGWCIHHNVDLWRKTTAVGPRTKELNVQPWSFWLAGGGWLCRHLWEHYQYSQDAAFLRERAYPLMRECASFYLDWLVEKDGKPVTCPSTSPENTFIDQGTATGVSYGSTMDLDVIRELFLNCLNGAKELEISEEQDGVLTGIKAALPGLPERKIGRYGQLQEWAEDYEEKEQSHRHLSHLYGLYPSDLFVREGLEEGLKKACQVTLERRGNDSVAWSRAWKINLQARLRNGEKAGEEVLQYLQIADSEDASEISYTNGGIYENLFAARPLQIDGCFGFTAGVAEMLVQDADGEVQVLPAIPSEWKCGYVKGLRLRDGRQIDIEWNGNDTKSRMYR